GSAHGASELNVGCVLDSTPKQLCGVEKAARRLPGLSTPLDFRCSGVEEACEVERPRIQDVEVQGSVLQADRPVWNGGVEVVAIGMAALGEGFFVVPKGTNPGGVRMLPRPCLQGVT